LAQLGDHQPRMDANANTQRSIAQVGNALDEVKG
jgi:hypothetical protein